MNRIKKTWLAFSLGALALAGCNISSTPETPISTPAESASSVPASSSEDIYDHSESISVPGESVSSLPPVSSSEDIYDHTELEVLSDISRNVSVAGSGYLGDISVGMSLGHNSTYPIVFTLSDNPSGTCRVYSDNENVLTANSDASKSNWTLQTHKAGEAHLIIEDGDGIIHFRHLVSVKPKLDLEAAKKQVYDVDHWEVHPGYVNFCGIMDLYFFKPDAKTGLGSATIDGTEGGGVTFNKTPFTYSYAPNYTETAEDLEHWYIFQVSNWTEQALVITYFAIWEAGDVIHLHSTQSLVGIFIPAEAE